MNSLLQQFFMNAQFRGAILQTNMRECHRTSIWHRQPEELEGMILLVEWAGGLWKKAKVVSYDPITKEHTLQYEDELHGESAVAYNLAEGRYQKETGHVRVIPPDKFIAEDGEEMRLDALCERDEGNATHPSKHTQTIRCPA